VQTRAGPRSDSRLGIDIATEQPKSSPPPWPPGPCPGERGKTTDQLRTTTAELSAPQRSTMDTSVKSFTLGSRGGPIWGSKSHEFLSCPLPP
jgi:hypothetical protein